MTVITYYIKDIIYLETTILQFYYIPENDVHENLLIEI